MRTGYPQGIFIIPDRVVAPGGSLDVFNPAKCQRVLRVVNRYLNLADPQRNSTGVMDEQIEIDSLLGSAAFDVGLLRVDLDG